MPDGLADASPEAFAAAEELRSFGDYILSNQDWRGSRGPAEAIAAAARARAGQVLTESAIENTRLEHEAPEEDKGLASELTDLLNRYSAENESGTPDFILAEFLLGVLKNYNETLQKRATWRGESNDLAALRDLQAPTAKRAFFLNKQRKL